MLMFIYMLYLSVSMKINRYYTDQNITGEDMSIRDKELLHRLSGVMRYRAGETLKLFNGKDNFDYLYEIKELNKKEGYLVFLSKEENVSNVTQKVNVYAAIVKSDFDDMLREMVEIGANELFPMISDRVERKELNYERLNKIIVEASEQCGRGNLPRLNGIMKLKDFMDFSAQNICYHTHKVSQNINVARESNAENMKKDNNVINIFIGPEGGWSDSEIEWFLENNFTIKTLNTNVLRAKTAASICLYDSTLGA
jgi:16S rRNA (uracil1498-N3)-methyltransferase